MDHDDDDIEEKKRLKWGETPWDGLSREELLRECQRMYAALQSAQSVIKNCRISSLWHRLPAGIQQDDVHEALESLAKVDGYWGYGVGGKTLEEVRQALSRADEFDSEDVYRSFFRYATDLLFEDRGGMHIGFGWDVCPECGVMIGRSGDGKRHGGMACKDTATFGRTDGKVCPGVLRPIEWSDLKPAATQSGV